MQGNSEKFYGKNEVNNLQRLTYDRKPIPVVAGSKAWVYGRSRAGIEGSNPGGSINVCPLCAMFVFR